MNFHKITVFIISVFIFIALIWKLEIFNLKKVEIEKNNVQCMDNQKLLSEFTIKGENILLMNEQNINKKILLKYPCVKNIIFKKQFPDKVKIIISGREGMARISYINLKELEATSASGAALIDWTFPLSVESDNFIIDDEGIIFAQNNESSLPYLYLKNQILKIGNKIENIDLNKVSLLFVKLPQMGIKINKTKINGQDFQVLGEQKIVFSLAKDVLAQFASLHLILEKAKIDERTMEIIDLRFDKPVVKYVPKK